MDYNIIIFISLFIFSALFSGTESALFSINHSQIEQLASSQKKQENKRITWILNWIENPERTLSIILMGNLTINILISDIGNTILFDFFGQNIVNFNLFSLIVLTLLLLIFGEIFPKTIAVQTSIKWSLLFSPINKVIFSILKVLSWPIHRVLTIITSQLPNTRKPFDESELLSSIELAYEYKVIENKEKNLLKKSVYYYYDTAYSAMVPKSQVFMVAHTITPFNLKKQFQETYRPLAIVYHEKDNEILGYIHARQLLLALHKKQKSIRNKIISIPSFPETMFLKEILQKFIATKSEVGIVLDEMGSFAGIITLKDILRTVMGMEHSNMQKNNLIVSIKGGYIISGQLPLNEFNDFFATQFTSENIETISGFILKIADGFPQKNTIIKYENFIFSDIEVIDYKINKMKVAKK